jgi:hypothetical protein
MPVLLQHCNCRLPAALKVKHVLFRACVFVSSSLHRSHRNQWRAMFVQNCVVDKLHFLPVSSVFQKCVILLASE